MNHQYRRLRMDTQLARGIMHAGNDHIERQVLEAIIREAYFSGIAPLTYLREKLATTNIPILAPVVETPAFVCQYCADKPAFKSQKALNGHMKKHSS
jgi:hypothetical protein